MKRGTYGTIKPGPFRQVEMNVEGHNEPAADRLPPINCTDCGRFTGPRNGMFNPETETWHCRACRTDGWRPWW